MDQFSLASALLEAHGGYREVAWRVAGELIGSGQSHEAVFRDLTNEAMESRVHAANEDYAASRR